MEEHLCKHAFMQAQHGSFARLFVGPISFSPLLGSSRERENTRLLAINQIKWRTILRMHVCMYVYMYAYTYMPFVRSVLVSFRESCQFARSPPTMAASTHNDSCKRASERATVSRDDERRRYATPRHATQRCGQSVAHCCRPGCGACRHCCSPEPVGRNSHRHLFVCSFVRSFVCSFVRSVRPIAILVGSLFRWLGHSFTLSPMVRAERKREKDVSKSN